MNHDLDPSVTAFVQKYPRMKIMAAPIVAAFEGQPYRSVLESVWIWAEDMRPRLFSGNTVADAVKEAEDFFTQNKHLT